MLEFNHNNSGRNHEITWQTQTLELCGKILLQGKSLWHMATNLLDQSRKL